MQVKALLKMPVVGTIVSEHAFALKLE